MGVRARVTPVGVAISYDSLAIVMCCSRVVRDPVDRAVTNSGPNGSHAGGKP